MTNSTYICEQLLAEYPGRCVQGLAKRPGLYSLIQNYNCVQYYSSRRTIIIRKWVRV